MNIIDDLEWRGAINQMTDEEGLRALTNEKGCITLLWGRPNWRQHAHWTLNSIYDSSSFPISRT